MAEKVYQKETVDPPWTHSTAILDRHLQQVLLKEEQQSNRLAFRIVGYHPSKLIGLDQFWPEAARSSRSDTVPLRQLFEGDSLMEHNYYVSNWGRVGRERDERAAEDEWTSWDNRALRMSETSE